MSPLETLLIESLEEYPEVELAVIFGSVARAEAGRKSDVDVGVRFQVPSRVLLSRLEVDLSRALKREVEVIALDDAPPLLRFEIARDGKVLVERKPHAWADFRARAMVDWWDWAPLARRIHAAAAARLRKRAMVRRDVAGRKVARATARLDNAESILSRSREDLSRDAASRDLAAFYLFLATQECIDLAAHWVADRGLAPPEDASSAFDVLAERGSIEPGTADALRGTAVLRNRITHGYGDIDHERVREEATDGVKALREFLLAVSNAAGL